MAPSQAKGFTITVADWTLLSIAVVWGSSYPAVKFVLNYSDVMLFIFIRFSLTALLMLPIFMIGIRGQLKETLAVGSVLGLILFLIFWCETAGVQQTTAVNAAFFISMCVLFTPLMESLVSRTHLKPRLILACCMSCVGAGLMGLNDDFQFHLTKGDLIILIAAFLRALGVIATKQLTTGKNLNSGAITFIQMLMVSLISGGWILYSENKLSLPVAENFWLTTLYLVLFCTLFAFYLQTHMIRQTSPTRVILIMGTEPIFGALFAIILLQEQLSLLQLGGGGLIIVSTYLGFKFHTEQYIEKINT